MSKLSGLINKLDRRTRLVIGSGASSALIYAVYGFIIYRFGENFNINMNKFALFEQYLSGAAAFLICTAIVAALCEYCMRQIHKSQE